MVSQSDFEELLLQGSRLRKQLYEVHSEVIVRLFQQHKVRSDCLGYVGRQDCLPLQEPASFEHLLLNHFVHLQLVFALELILVEFLEEIPQESLPVHHFLSLTPVVLVSSLIFALVFSGDQHQYFVRIARGLHVFQRFNHQDIWQVEVFEGFLQIRGTRQFEYYREEAPLQAGNHLFELQGGFLLENWSPNGIVSTFHLHGDHVEIVLHLLQKPVQIDFSFDDECFDLEILQLHELERIPLLIVENPTQNYLNEVSFPFSLGSLFRGQELALQILVSYIVLDELTQLVSVDQDPVVLGLALDFPLAQIKSTVPGKERRRVFEEGLVLDVQRREFEVLVIVKSEDELLEQFRVREPELFVFGRQDYHCLRGLHLELKVLQINQDLTLETLRVAKDFGRTLKIKNDKTRDFFVLFSEGTQKSVPKQLFHYNSSTKDIN